MSQNNNQENDAFIKTRSTQEGVSKSGKMTTTTMFIDREEVARLLDILSGVANNEDGGVITVYRGEAEGKKGPYVYTTILARASIPQQQQQQAQPKKAYSPPQQKRAYSPGRR